jgi:hypothetical protein
MLMAKTKLGVAYRSTRRNWVKLWTHEWLRGTSRFELKPWQRSAFIDLLAMAGDSKIPGKVCAGLDADGAVLGFPKSYLAGQLTITEADLDETLILFREQDRVSIEDDKRGNPIITLISWEKYQSEYHRQKSYRSNSPKVTSEVTTETPVKLPVEGEGDVEVEEEGEAEATVAAFAAISCKPFGGAKFKEFWTNEYLNHKSGSWADAMEHVAELCQANRVKVPGRFFAHKREIEKVEAEQAYKRTPL